MFDTIKAFSNVTDFVSSIFELLGTFVGFMFNFLKTLPSYLSSLVDFIRVYVIELPITLISMFEVLPPFVQTGLIVILYAIYISFAFRLLKLLIPLL